MGAEYVRGWTDAEKHYHVGPVQAAPEIIDAGVYDATVLAAVDHITHSGRHTWRLSIGVEDKKYSRVAEMTFFVLKNEIFDSGTFNSSLLNLIYAAGFRGNEGLSAVDFVGARIKVDVEHREFYTRNHRVDFSRPYMRASIARILQP